MTSKIEYALFRLLAWLVRPLSPRGAQRVGAGLGLATLLCTGYRTKVTRDNLARAFPELPAAERARIMRGAYRNYGIALVEMLWTYGQDPGVLAPLVQIENPELLERALGRGKGVILLSAHYGSWELLLSSVRLHIPVRVTAIAQRQRNEYVDAHIDMRRRRFDTVTVPMGPAVREVLVALQRNEVVLILGDQSGPKESIFVPFFDRPSATHRGAAAFALRTGAAMLALFLVRQTDGTYRGAFEEIDTSVHEGSREDQVVELTIRHAAVLERAIRRHPDHWLWMHKRWKHTPYYEALHQNDAAPGTDAKAKT
jgi:Kdo2-lipid IVA lauroyltransferase/acyltransferase